MFPICHMYKCRKSITSDEYNTIQIQIFFEPMVGIQNEKVKNNPKDKKIH